MSATDDLQLVNHVLRELVRLQLTGELEAEVAWRERRQMLESVEAAWDVLVENAGEAAETGTDVAEAAQPADAPARKPISMAAIRSWRLPLWALLLVFALATFLYVGSL